MSTHTGPGRPVVARCQPFSSAQRIFLGSSSKCIKKSEVIAYDDLGTEAIRKLEVENFPVIVVIDAQGNNLYETAITDYQR